MPQSSKCLSASLAFLLVCVGCKKSEERNIDPSGLSELELNAPIEEIVELTKEQIEELKQPPSFYQEKLAAEAGKSADEWRKIIDTLHAGMTVEQVEAVLPRKSMSGSYLWSYSGMRIEDTRQTQIWAVDSKHAVAVEVDFTGDYAWDNAGKPKPRTVRYSNRITGRPWLLLHSNSLDEYGMIDRSDCRIP